MSNGRPSLGEFRCLDDEGAVCGECEDCNPTASTPLVEARERIKAAEWVAADAGDFPDVYTASLTAAPNRADWFAKVLPDLDYEIKGGTWDEPKWAWTEHPWYAALGLTNEECVAHLQGAVAE